MNSMPTWAISISCILLCDEFRHLVAAWNNNGGWQSVRTTLTYRQREKQQQLVQHTGIFGVNIDRTSYGGSLIPTSRMSTSVSLSSSLPAYGLYEVQEDMLIKRGIYEEDLMRAAISGPLTAHKRSKGGSRKGATKGFGGSGKSTRPAGRAGSSRTTKSSSWPSTMFIDEANQQATVLTQQGVVRVDDVLSSKVADGLRTFVTQLRQESMQQIETGQIRPTERFANVLLRSNRCDLILPLGNQPRGPEELTTAGPSLSPVIEALHCVLCESSIYDTIVKCLGKDAVLYELSCLISDPGSQRQVVHPDNPYIDGRTDPTLLTCFIALQDIDETMGPTVFLPQTHTRAHHTAFADEAVPVITRNDKDDVNNEVKSESPKDALLRTTPSVLGTLSKGSCALYDSRVLHCGSANRSAISRAIFYFSFRHPKVVYPGNPASIRSDLGQAQLTLENLTRITQTTYQSGGQSNPFTY